MKTPLLSDTWLITLPLNKSQHSFLLPKSFEGNIYYIYILILFIVFHVLSTSESVIMYQISILH